VLACVNHGWTFEDCERVLLDPTAPTAHLWQSDSGHAEKPFARLRRDYQRAAAKWAESPNWQNATDVRQWLGERTAEVNRAAWPGRAGRTDKAVMLAVLHIARIGTDEPDVSVRDVAMKAGCTARTASTSLKRLCEAGWLAPRWASQPDGHAKRYKVSHKFTHNSLRSSADYVCRNETALDGTGAFHECWVRLGKAALAIWRALGGTPLSAADIADAAGVGRATAFRWLPRLAAYRLATRCDGGWIAGSASPDDVVKAEGWIGDNSIVEKRRQRHEEDRAQYAVLRERRGRRDAMQRADALATRRPHVTACPANDGGLCLCEEIGAA
jgi:hypothetical protein